MDEPWVPKCRRTPRERLEEELAALLKDAEPWVPKVKRDTQKELDRLRTKLLRWATGRRNGMKARCKFRVGSVTRDEHMPAETVKLHTLYDENDPDDTKFAEATPWGSMEIGISNPNLVGHFEPGQVYYVDLIPVECSSWHGGFDRWHTLRPT